MAIDQSKIGAVAAQLMDIVEEAHGEAEAEVSAVSSLSPSTGERGATLSTTP